jgi:hypothetical protein
MGRIYRTNGRRMHTVYIGSQKEREQQEDQDVGERSLFILEK